MEPETAREDGDVSEKTGLVSRRRAVGIGLALVLVLAMTSAVFWWWSRARVIQAGSAVVLVEGRDLSLTGTSEAGVGIVGTLGLLGDRCVGFVTDGEGSVIVWPAGTSVSGSGEKLTITSEGETVRIGDRIDGGTLQRSDFPEFDGRLPEACEGFPLIDVGLNS